MCGIRAFSGLCLYELEQAPIWAPKSARRATIGRGWPAILHEPALNTRQCPGACTGHRDYGICGRPLLVLARTPTRDGFRALAGHYAYQAARNQPGGVAESRGRRGGEIKGSAFCSVRWARGRVLMSGWVAPWTRTPGRMPKRHDRLRGLL